MQTNFVILDPGLRDFRGHFFNYDSAVAKAAADVFDRVRVICSREFDEAESYGFEAVFRNPEKFFWVRALRRLTGRTMQRAEALSSISAGEIAGEAWRGGILNRGFLRFRSFLFARDLAAAFGKGAGSAGGRVHVFCDAKPVALEALDAFVRGNKVCAAECVFHLILRSGPEYCCRCFESPDAFAARLTRLAEGNVPRVRFYTDTRELAAAYSALTDGAVRFVVLPIPVFMPETSSLRRRAADGCVRLGVMGIPRREKGFLLLPELVKIFPAAMCGRRVVLRVQTDPFASDSAVVEAGAELRRLAASGVGPEVELWSGSSDPGEYAAWCADSDISLLLHNSSRYRLSSSGVLMEALHFGMPVTAFSGTWMAGVIADAADAGLRIGETVGGVEDISGAVERLVGDLEQCGRDAAEYYGVLKKNNSPERLVEILAGEECYVV